MYPYNDVAALHCLLIRLEQSFYNNFSCIIVMLCSYLLLCCECNFQRIKQWMFELHILRSYKALITKGHNPSLFGIHNSSCKN